MANKSDFIRARPNKSVVEIIADAEKQGFTVSAGLIYAVRSASKTKTPKAVRAATGSSDAASLGAIEGAIRSIVKQELKTLLAKL